MAHRSAQSRRKSASAAQEDSRTRRKSRIRKDSDMNASHQIFKALQFLILGSVFLLLTPTRSQAQVLTVDCSGTNPYAYPSINAALPNAGPGAFILITGTCNENVFLWGQNGLNIGAYYGQAATVNG